MADIPLESMRWRERVKAILMSVADVSAEGRGAFLERTCGGDMALLQEVRDLLQYERTDAVAPGLEAAGEADAPEEGSAAATARSRTGLYVIEGVQGMGGMGTVYWVAKRGGGAPGGPQGRAARRPVNPGAALLPAGGRCTAAARASRHHPHLRSRRLRGRGRAAALLGAGRTGDHQVGATAQAVVDLVHQLGGAQRVVGALAAETVVGQLAQFVVEGGEEVVGGWGVFGGCHGCFPDDCS